MFVNFLLRKNQRAHIEDQAPDSNLIKNHTNKTKLKCNLSHTHTKLSFKSSHHELPKPDSTVSCLPLKPYSKEVSWQLLCPDHICLLTSIFQAACIRCGYISLRLSTSALDRRPIFTSFNLTLGSCQGENYASRTWQLVLNILLSRIKYIIIFLKIALPHMYMYVYIHIYIKYIYTDIYTHTLTYTGAQIPLHICVYLFFSLYTSDSSCTKENGTYVLNFTTQLPR